MKRETRKTIIKVGSTSIANCEATIEILGAMPIETAILRAAKILLDAGVDLDKVSIYDRPIQVPVDDIPDAMIEEGRS